MTSKLLFEGGEFLATPNSLDVLTWSGTEWIALPPVSVVGLTPGQVIKLNNLSGVNSGDVTVTDTSTIDFGLAGQVLTGSVKDGSIINAKLALMQPYTVKLNPLAVDGAPIDGTVAQVKTLLDLKANDIGWDQGTTNVFGGNLYDAIAHLDNYKADNADIVHINGYEVIAGTKEFFAQPVGINAESIGFTPVGTIGASDVQSALAELSNEKISGNAPIPAATHTKITYDTKGFVTSGTDITTDDVIEGVGPNIYFTKPRVLLVTLSNFSLANPGDVTSADSIEQAFGKLQRQIDDLTISGGGLTPATDAETEAGTLTNRALTPAAGEATYLKNSKYTAKGDIISSSASDSPSVLNVGADGQILSASSLSSTGLRWINAPTGSIPPPSKFVLDFVVLDWVLSGGDSTLTVPVGTHQNGINPSVQVLSDQGLFHSIENVDIDIYPTGNVVIKVPNGAAFIGRIVIH